MSKYIIIIGIVVAIIIAVVAVVFIVKSSLSKPSSGNTLIDSGDYLVPLSMDIKNVKYITEFYNVKLKKYIDELHVVKDDKSFVRITIIILMYLGHMSARLNENFNTDKIPYEQLSNENITYIKSIEPLVTGKPDLLVDAEFVLELGKGPYPEIAQGPKPPGDSKLITMFGMFQLIIMMLSQGNKEVFYNY